MERIKRLTEETINKIAAGEVIDRPASVLKELAENSLDAAASHVSINIADAGLSLIEVSDNGRGMEPGDLRRALLRHTTSKIEDVTDLLSITSFGFRGEALASIASVSKVEISSIPEGRNEGIEIIAVGGKIIGERPVTGDCGTLVKVRDLFFNTPARKKFLKSRKVEQASLKSVFWDLAIPCTGVDFLYRSDSSELTTVPADVAIFDRVRLRESEIGDTLQDFTEVSPYFAISGLVSLPVKTFARTNRIFVFANRRAVKDSMCVGAVKEGMRGLIPENRFPCAYLFIEVSPEEADFNVHPAKREVRFRFRKELFELIRYSVRNLFVGGDFRDEGANDLPLSADFWVPRDRDGMGIFRDRAPGEAPFESGIGPSFRSVTEAGESHELFTSPGSLSRMKIVGQVLGNYLLLDGGDELLFLDIHAASERINYWKVQKEFKHWLESPEHLLISVDVPEERLRGHTEDVQELLVEVGYRVELHDGVVKIQAVPLYLKGFDPLSVVEDILEMIEGGSIDAAAEPKRVLDDLMARMACHTSLRGTRRIPDGELRYLLDDLASSGYSQTCPHGRPVFIKVTRGDLHKLFGRT